MDIGAHLRGAREGRGLTLEQVASSTKLSTLVLRSIEHNEWDRLPGGLLTRGHLRAYAAAVNVDPETVVHEYVAQLPAQTVQAAPASRALAFDRRPVASPLLIAAVGLLILGVINWLGQSPAAPPTPSERDPLPAARESSVVLDEAAEVAPATESLVSGLSLAIAATGPCWVSATADGRVVLYRLLEAGEAVTVAAEDELVLRVGDPGMFTYTLNGMSGRPLGDVGQPVTVTITRSNVQTFLVSAAPTKARS